MKELNELCSIMESIVKEYMSEPDHLKIRVSRTDDPSVVQVIILPHDNDIGRVIGPQGARYKAIKSIFEEVASRSRLMCHVLWIPEPNNKRRDIPVKFSPNPNWPKARVIKLARSLGNLVFAPGPVDVVSLDGGSDTMIVLRVSQKEQTEAPRLLAPAFAALFESVGNAVGRRITVQLQAI